MLDDILEVILLRACVANEEVEAALEEAEGLKECLNRNAGGAVFADIGLEV